MTRSTDNLDTEPMCLKKQKLKEINTETAKGEPDETREDYAKPNQTPEH